VDSKSSPASGSSGGGSSSSLPFSPPPGSRPSSRGPPPRCSGGSFLGRRGGRRSPGRSLRPRRSARRRSPASDVSRKRGCRVLARRWPGVMRPRARAAPLPRREIPGRGLPAGSSEDSCRGRRSGFPAGRGPPGRTGRPADRRASSIRNRSSVLPRSPGTYKAAGPTLTDGVLGVKAKMPGLQGKMVFRRSGRSGSGSWGRQPRA
jgi:hypothetical protein